MAKVKVTMGGQATRLARDLASGGKVVRRIVAIAREATREAREDLDDAWPRLRNNRGEIMEGEQYRRAAKRKGHSILRHSGDLFVTKSSTRGDTVSERVSNPAEWAFKIRSRQVGRSDAENQDRFRRRKNESKKRYIAQIQSGPAPHAWSTLGTKPWKKRMRTVADDVREAIKKG